MSAALLVAGALLLAGGHGGGTDTPDPGTTPSTTAPAVQMSGQAFLPRDVVALVDEDVTWTNTDSRNHTVTDSQGDAFDSGAIPPGGTYVHSFAAQGSYTYRCTIHRFMVGTVRVYGLDLEAPSAVRPGTQATFAGRAPAGTMEAVLERREADGAFAAVAPLMLAEDGSYAISVRVDEPGTYRVRAGELTSRNVQVRLTARVHASGRRQGANVVVDAHVEPPRAGTALLQRYVRERFDWRTVQRAPIGADGHARFTLRARDEVYLRVVASGLGGGWTAGASRAVRIAKQPRRPV